MYRQTSVLCSLGLLVTQASAFYLPGAAPHDFQSGEHVDVFVNALTPMIGTADNAKLVSLSILLFVVLITES
jgi:transmembrane 9 superfamily member 2/4